MSKFKTTDHCTECGNQVEGDEPCPDHPNADITTIATLLASDGTALGVGVRVIEGDVGTVVEVKGDSALVNWDSCANDAFWVAASDLRGSR